MFDFHKSNEVYFKYQHESTKEYILPIIAEMQQLDKNARMMEIGCGEGGNMLCFAELGVNCIGIDLNTAKLKKGEQIFKEAQLDHLVSFISDDIYNREAEYRGVFDVILLKDVIEHIHNQQKLIDAMKLMLKPTGMIFFAFPPWYMPFGGHQQIIRKKIPSLIPFTHLLPKFLYKAYLKMLGEPEEVIQDLMEVKETGISIERFEKCIKNAGLKIAYRQLYFINPNYKWKFGLKPRLVRSFFKYIPFFRNFYTTTAYYGIKL